MSPRGGRKPVEIGDTEQRHTQVFLEKLGAKVYKVGTRRRKGDFHGTMQTPGISDLLAFMPVRNGRRRGLWVESKAGRGSLSDDQAVFKALCELAGWDHIVGDQNAVVAWCLREGYIRETQVPWYRLPGATSC